MESMESIKPTESIKYLISADLNYFDLLITYNQLKITIQFSYTPETQDKLLSIANSILEANSITNNDTITVNSQGSGNSFSIISFNPIERTITIQSDTMTTLFNITIPATSLQLFANDIIEKINAEPN